MGKHATILVGPSLATLEGGDFDVLQRVCSAEDEEIKRSAAFRSGRIDDCRVSLNNGNVFPAGLYGAVRKAHKKRGWKVTVKFTHPPKYIDPALVTPDLLIGLSLWDHQIASIVASLNEPHGHIHSGTGSGKTADAAAIALLALREHGESSLVLAGSKGTAFQVAKDFKGFYGEGIDIGFIGDGRKRPGDITVAVPDTLNRILLAASRDEELSAIDNSLLEFVQNVDNLLVDEAQRISAEGAYLVAMVCQARRKIGLSGTPLVRKRLRDLKMLGATGPRLIRVTSAELIEKNLSAFPKIAVVTDPSFYPPENREVVKAKWRQRGYKPKGAYSLQQYNLDYAAMFTSNPRHNKRVVVKSALWFADHKLPCLILCRKIPHFMKLRRLLEKSGVSYAAVTGSSPQHERTSAKEQLAVGSIRILLASDIFSRGEDMPSVRGLILAEGVKSFENLMQRIGRGMRVKKMGVNEVWVVDSAPPTSHILSKQGDVRVDAYVEAGYMVKRFPTFSMERLEKFFNTRREGK